MASQNEVYSTTFAEKFENEHCGVSCHVPCSVQSEICVGVVLYTMTRP